MAIHRVTARWSGFTGAPGYSAFHFSAGGGIISDAQSSANRVMAAFQAVRSMLPDGVAVQVQPEVEVIDESTGVLEGYEDIDVDTYSPGSGSGGYSAASGAVINWRTDNVRNGRRILGRTFIVPLAGEAYQDDGTLNGAAITALNGFADELVGFDIDSRFGVWARPINGAGGQMADATSFRIPDMAAVLRSRRD